MRILLGQLRGHLSAYCLVLGMWYALSISYPKQNYAKIMPTYPILLANAFDSIASFFPWNVIDFFVVLC
jgi:hypothetical protein